MMIVIITFFCVSPDPFAAERIARSGPVIYFLFDKVLRGAFFGALAGTFLYIWTWLPMGALWHILSGWIENAPRR